METKQISVTEYRKHLKTFGDITNDQIEAIINSISEKRGKR